MDKVVDFLSPEGEAFLPAIGMSMSSVSATLLESSCLRFGSGSRSVFATAGSNFAAAVVAGATTAVFAAAPSRLAGGAAASFCTEAAAGAAAAFFGCDEGEEELMDELDGLLDEASLLFVALDEEEALSELI